MGLINPVAINDAKAIYHLATITAHTFCYLYRRPYFYPGVFLEPAYINYIHTGFYLEYISDKNTQHPLSRGGALYIFCTNAP
jgi:hypothetical protein